MTSRRTWFCLLLVSQLALMASCTGKKVTQIVVSIATDLKIPAELEAVSLNVERTVDGELQRVVENTWDVVPEMPDAIDLPATIALMAGKDPDRQIEITVLGLHKSRDPLTRKARLPFARDRVLLLSMNLLRSCLYRKEPCPDGMTCEETGCVPIDKDPSQLPDYNEAEALKGLDAGDGAALQDAGVDGAVDTGASDALQLDSFQQDTFQQDIFPPDDLRPDDLRPDDLRPDDLQADLPVPDLPVPDLPVPDLPVPDLPVPDLPVPDLPVPDLPVPDSPVPDSPVPDSPVPDSPVPDSALADSVLADSALADSALADSALADMAPACIHPTVVEDCKQGWCTIVAGCFQMGSLSGEICRGSDEDPHQVTLTRDFEMSETEVTQGQFESVMGYNPACFDSNPEPKCVNHNGDCNHPTCPVEMVTWHEAAAYCNTLSVNAGVDPCYSCTGSEEATVCDVAPAYNGITDPYVGYYDCPGYRLPTEAEWEYATRAGTTGHTYGGMLAVCIGVDAVASSIAWYFSNSAGMTQHVKGKLPNNWGLYDVCGNVWEWTFDSYLEHWGSGDQIDPWLPGIDRRVVRGTSFYGDPGMMRSANRGWRTQTDREWDVGFRCVKSL